MRDADLRAARAATLAPSEAAAAKLAAAGKLYVRERIALLFDPDTFVEDGQLANALATGLPADGVVTGQGLVDGRPALVVANEMRMVCLGNLCIVWFLPRQSGCSKNAVQRARTITLCRRGSPSRRASTHELARGI